MHRYHDYEQEDTKLLWILNVCVGKTASFGFSLASLHSVKRHCVAFLRTCEQGITI